MFYMAAGSRLSDASNMQNNAPDKRQTSHWATSKGGQHIAAENSPLVPSQEARSRVLKFAHACPLYPLLGAGRFGRQAVQRSPHGADPLLDVRAKLFGGFGARGPEFFHAGR
jgi:hypothetical protein